MRPLMALAGLILMVSSLFLISAISEQSTPLASGTKLPFALGVLGAAAFFAGTALPSSEESGPRRGLDPEFLAFMDEMRDLRSRLEGGLITREEFNRLRAEIYGRYRGLFQRYLERGGR